jgi:nitrite reductase/ring-hydroxylating ferredoxin subunit
MLRERSIQIAQDERKQRRALVLFAVVLLVLTGLCSAIGLQLLTLPAKSIAAGSVSDYADGKPHQLSVPRLQVSSMILQRDETLSEDTIFVRRESDGSFIALLGVDTFSGCFLYWDAQRGLFHDVNCQGARYTPDGVYLDGLNSSQQPQNMARLPVEVRDGLVFVRDEIARER